MPSQKWSQFRRKSFSVRCSAWFPRFAKGGISDCERKVATNYLKHTSTAIRHACHSLLALLPRWLLPTRIHRPTVPSHQLNHILVTAPGMTPASPSFHLGSSASTPQLPTYAPHRARAAPSAMCTWHAWQRQGWACASRTGMPIRIVQRNVPKPWEGTCSRGWASRFVAMSTVQTSTPKKTTRTR